MASTQEKLKGNATSATPKKIVETDHDNLHLSRDQFIAKYRKKDEIEAKLELEKKRLEALAEEESKNLENVGSEDNKVSTQEEV